MTTPTSKKLTLRQIAKLAGTSKSTVSRVLTNHPSVSPETRQRVEEVIEENQYRPNFFARGLAGGRSGLIAVLSRWMQSGFFAEVVRGIDEEIAAYHGHVLSSQAHSDEDYVRLWEEFASGGLVDGIILIAPPRNIFDVAIQSDYAPCVLCASSAEQMEKGWENVDAVTVNNKGAMQALLGHLHQQGCNHIVHVPGDPVFFDANERRNAFNEFFASKPGTTGETIEEAHTIEMGKRVAERYLDSGKPLPDAFAAFNDAAATGLLQAFNERGVKVPEDTALTGFDDETVAAILGLTTIHMPMVELGKISAKYLVDRLEKRTESAGGRHHVVEMTIQQRKSSMRKQYAAPTGS